MPNLEGMLYNVVFSNLVLYIHISIGRIVPVSRLIVDLVQHGSGCCQLIRQGCDQSDSVVTVAGE